jgi:hypothetical protein
LSFSAWTGPKFSVGGIALKRRRVKWFPARFAYDAPDGSVIEMQPAGLDPIPNIWIDGVKTQVGRPLDNLEKVLCYLPLLSSLGVCGGFIPILIAVIGTTTNFNIMRSDRPRGQRIGLAILTSVLAFVLSMVIVIAILSNLGDL